MNIVSASVHLPGVLGGEGPRRLFQGEAIHVGSQGDDRRGTGGAEFGEKSRAGDPSGGDAHRLQLFPEEGGGSLLLKFRFRNLVEPPAEVNRPTLKGFRPLEKFRRGGESHFSLLRTIQPRGELPPSGS